MAQSGDSLCSVQCLGFRSSVLRWPWKSQTNQDSNENVDQKSVCKPAWTWNLCKGAKKPCCNPTKFSVSLFQTPNSESKKLSVYNACSIPWSLGISYINYAYVMFQL